LKSAPIERLVVALDEDLHETAVDSDARRLAEFLASDFEVRFARWDGRVAKGFDDCLLRIGRFVLTGAS